MNGAPLHLDARLDWIIARSEVTTPRAERRMNAIENSLAGLAHQWRAGWVLTLEQEVRMSTPTRMALVEWVEAEEPAGGPTGRRLLRYIGRETLDETVPDGWIRILIMTPAEGQG